MNPRLSITHLSEEAINDVLVGMSTPAHEEHLADCQLCRSRVADFRSNLALFNQAALAWAELKAEKKPASIRPVQIRPIRSLTTAHPLPWKPVTAAAAVLFLAAALWNHQHAQDVSTQVYPAQTVPEQTASNGSSDPNPDQIAQDNQLLRNVYDALEDEPQSPVSEFSLTATSPIGSNSSSPTPAKARTQ